MASANPNNPPIAQEPVLQEGANSFSFAWYQWFTKRVAAILTAPVSSAVPATSGAAGTTGQAAQDGNYLYICVATNTWKRIALTTF
jgi:hypothetical protein